MLSPLEVLSTYQSMQERINWFLQITGMFPEVLTAVRDEVDKDVKLENPLCQVALKTAMKDLTPVFDSFLVPQERNQWIQQVNQLQSITQQMRNMYQEDEDDIIWREWTRVMMFKLFVHHVLSQDVTPELNQIVCKKIKAVWQALKDPNMKKYKSFKLFIAMLKMINKEAACLHFTGGVNECVRCGDIPDQAVALPCGDVGCARCFIQLFEGKDGQRRCPKKGCKNSKVP